MSISWTMLLALGLAQQGGPNSDPLEPLTFLVGSCWVGTLPDGKTTDEHCFEWMLEGKVMRDQNVVAGDGSEYRGETILSWDPEKKQVRFWSWGSDGEVSSGTVDYTPNGIELPGKHVRGSTVKEMKSVWRRTGPKRCRTSVTERDGDEWKEVRSMELEQRPPGR